MVTKFAIKFPKLGRSTFCDSRLISLIGAENEDSNGTANPFIGAMLILSKTHNITLRLCCCYCKQC